MDNQEILQYSNLVYSLANSFSGYSNKDDLYQAGYLGLIYAYQNFDSSYGVKFSTYAYNYIIGEMKKLIREDKGIKVGKSLVKLNRQIEDVRGILAQKYMRPPTVREIADFLSISDDVVIYALNIPTMVSSLDESISDDGKEITLNDVTSDNSLDINTLIAFKEELLKLSDDEKKLISDRFLDNLSQSEIARRDGVNQVKISRLESKVKQKIKVNMVA